MLKQYPFRSAYTLLELIFVIVILGIVSSIGAELIAKVYENYIIQRANHRAELKTELAALQIANRLRYAIPGTLYRIKSDDTLESTFLPLTTGMDYKGLQWVGYDGDSFEAVTSAADRRPGWSGFADVEHGSTDINHIKTQGSNLTLANTIIGNLSPSGKAITDAYIYFPYENAPSKVNGYTGATNDVITLAAPAAGTRTIHEHYKLAWSSYALYINNGDLFLYYDFPATLAANKGNTKQLLLKNVTTFKFKVTGRTIRFKLCVQEEIGKDYNITACKEKAVF